MSEYNTIRTAGCFVEYNGRFIILQRHSDKPQGGTWGLPAGKVAKGEDDVETVLREVEEETGYKASKDELEFVDEIHWDFPEYRVEFPTFRIRLKEPIDVSHRSDEHQGFKWVTPEECYAMPDLIHGFHDLLEKIGYVDKQNLTYEGQKRRFSTEPRGHRISTTRIYDC